MIKQDDSAKAIQKRIGILFAAIPLSPDAWTALSLLVALGAAILIGSVHELLIGLLLFCLAGALDMVDGAVARARGETSAFGGFLDGIADRFVEALFLFSMMLYPLPSILVAPQVWLSSVLFLGTCMPSFIRAYADHKGVVSREKALALSGICERSERIGLLVIGLAAGMLIGMELFIYALMLISALSAITVLQRLGRIHANENA